MNKRAALLVISLILMQGILVSAPPSQSQKWPSESQRYHLYNSWELNTSRGTFTPITITELSPVQSYSPIKVRNGTMNSPWPMLSHDLNHTGRSELSTARNPGAELWRIRSSYNSEMLQTTPVIDNNGTIYIGLLGYDNNSCLISYYPNGTEKWRFLTGTWIWCTPAIGDDGTLYFSTCGGHYLFAVNPNGTLKWKYYAVYESRSSPAIGTDGTIYFGTNIGRLYALRPNGTLKWHHMLGGGVESGITIGPDGTLYLGCDDYSLYAIDPATGNNKWYFQTGYEIKASPSLSSDGTIYVPSFDGYLYALYSNNGTFKWRVTTGPTIAGDGCAIANDGTIYIGTEKLRAYNPNGTLKWETDVNGWVYGTVPAISSDGTIYVAGGGSLVAVNPNGTIKWYKQLSTVQIQTSPSIGPDDRVYIASTGPGNPPATNFSAFGVGPVRADAQGPYYGATTIPLQLQGLDFGGIPPYTYFWDFGDGNTSTLINPVHTYSQGGNYTASFTIMDSQGNSSSDSTTVFIDNPPNTPIITGSSQGKIRHEYTYNFVTTDPEDDAIEYWVEWGDGGNTGWLGPYLSGEAINLSYTWMKQGTYMIKCKARDSQGWESSWGILKVTMPLSYEQPYFRFLDWLFERFPHAFPILHRLLFRNYLITDKVNNF